MVDLWWERYERMQDKRVLKISWFLRITLLLVGVHSVLLGSTIYFFTVPFYQFFFSVEPSNFFFVKQAGVFLFLMGFFYLLPVLDMRRYKLAIFLVVFSKVVAVAFLLINAGLTPSPAMIYLAALGDSVMAVTISILIILRFRYDDNGGFTDV